MKIRLVEEKDYTQVLRILNEAIKERKFTAKLSLATYSERKDWLHEHSTLPHPMFVAEMDGQVVGWITLTEFREGREGFRFISEVSYYIERRYHRMGIGSRLMEQAIQAACEIGFRNLVAVVFDTNVASQALIKRYGFELWGHLPEVVDIDGKRIACDYWGCNIEKMNQT